jgi:hypothetical protein
VHVTHGDAGVIRRYELSGQGHSRPDCEGEKNSGSHGIQSYQIRTAAARPLCQLISSFAKLYRPRSAALAACGRPSKGMMRTSWISSVSMATYPNPVRSADCCCSGWGAGAVPRSREPDKALPPAGSPGRRIHVPFPWRRSRPVSFGTISEVRRFQATLDWSNSSPNCS